MDALSFNFVEVASPECSTGPLKLFEIKSIALSLPVGLVLTFSLLWLTGFISGKEWLRERGHRTTVLVMHLIFMWGIKVSMETWA